MDPSSAIQLLYKQSPERFPAIVTDYFEDLYAPDDAFNNIPILDILHPPETHNERAVVSLRAMIQDTSSSPEIYLLKRAHGLCGGWGLADTEELAAADTIEYPNYLRECTVLWAVSIPGESPWCSNGESQDSSNSYVSPKPHKFPIPGAAHVGVKVKIYDNRLVETLRTTDLTTFVGILTSDPVYEDLETQFSVLVPTLHVLCTHPIPSTLIRCMYRDPSFLPLIKQSRTDLITWIADEALAGDRDAAEWVLLSAVSRVQSRSPLMLPLSFTLAGFPSPSHTHATIPTLYNVLSLILPMVTNIPLSLEMLNETTFKPTSKDEDLHSGWMQLPQGSACIVTENGITEGTITENGLRNLQAMQDIVNNQTLEYIFPYSQFPFQTDVTLMFLTEGKKSAFFQTGVTAQLQSGSERQYNLYKPACEIYIPPTIQLDAFRQLVGGAKIGNTHIGKEMAMYIEEDFVQERKNPRNGTPLSPGELTLRLNIARLLAISFHQSEVTPDIWQLAKNINEKRNSRLIINTSSP